MASFTTDLFHSDPAILTAALSPATALGEQGQTIIVRQCRVDQWEKREYLGHLTCNPHGTCLDRLHVKMRLLCLIIWSHGRARK